MLQGLLLSTFPHFDSPKVSNNELVMKFTFRRGKNRNRVVMVKNSKQRLKKHIRTTTLYIHITHKNRRWYTNRSIYPHSAARKRIFRKDHQMPSWQALETLTRVHFFSKTKNNPAKHYSKLPTITNMQLFMNHEKFF